MNTDFNNLNQQLIRFEKLNSEDFFLLSKSNDEFKLIFKICGSTKNVYETKIYFKSRMIYCNCPDSKSWARKYQVICKHSCFVLFKVLRLKINKLDFFNKLIFNEDEILEIKNNYDKLNMNNYNEDYLNKNYISKYQEIKDNKNKKKDNIVVNTELSEESFCGICYIDFDDIKNIKDTFQCLVCFKILHNKCILKWTSMGNKTCPYCRSIIKRDSNNKYLNLE